MNALTERVRRIARRRRGQSLVELALITPIVLLLMMGVADLGFVLYAHVQVASAAGEGARVAAHYTGNASLPDVTSNDNARLGLVKKAVYDSTSTPTTSSLGRLRIGSPFFNIGSYAAYSASDDVWIQTNSNTGGITRRGEEVVVNVRYREPVLFGIIPGLSNMRFTVSSTSRVRIP